VAAGVAYRAVRNRGTIGGSLAHADPAADWPSTLLALDAVVAVAGPAGAREIAVGEFLRGAFATALEPGEIATAVLVPKLSPQARWGYYKICRKAGEFPDAIGAVVIDPPRGVSRVVMGALDGTPVLLPGLSLNAAPEAIATAVAAAAPALDAVDHRLHAVAVRRALAQASAP
jgi:carbon-monoxide dehydrogenase medium subunit